LSISGGGGGATVWGGITGTLASQTDLQAALNARQPLATVLTNTTASFTAAQETKLAGIATAATANATDAQLRDRATHTGAQSLDTTTDSATRLAMTAAERTKLSGVATGATANATDAALRDRTTHTGTQAAATISDFTAAARAQVEAALIAGANVTITPSGSGATRQLTIAASGGGGGGGPPLGPHDFWAYDRIGTTIAGALNLFSGAGIASGTNNAALPAVQGIAPGGVFLRSSATANSGYRYQTTSLAGQTFGGVGRKFRGHFRWRTSFTGRTVRIGFHDTTTVTDAVDGAYFEIWNDVCIAGTASNSTRTTAGTTATLALDTLYTFDIDVNAAANEARFRVYAGTSSTPVLDQTITTNIPASSARVFGAGIVATEASTTASDIGVLFGMGYGTIEAFNRAYG
jgi:hypothetical protein